MMLVENTMKHIKCLLWSLTRHFALQVVIAIAEKYMRSADPSYPVGRTRLEAVGVVACAVIMTIATIEVIQAAAMDLANGFAKGLHLLSNLCMLPWRQLLLGS